MDIYNLEYKTINEAIDNKNKKIINQFLRLPVIIKKRFLYGDIDIDTLMEQIKISDYCDIISMFQDDTIMFEKIYIKMLLSIKKTSVQKYRFNKIKENIINIGNHLISHLMGLIEKNQLDKFRKIINKHKEIFDAWDLSIKKQKIRHKKTYNLSKKIVELYNKEFQKLSIYIASINREKFLNIIIDSNLIKINYNFLSNIINKYTNVFSKLYTNNKIISNFVDKNIMKLMHLLYNKNMHSILNKYLDTEDYFFFTFSKELIKNKIKNKNLKIINTQKNITSDNKRNFLETIKYISINLDHKYIIEYLENSKINLNDKDTIELLEFSKKRSININYDTVFRNYLKKGKIKIIKHFVNEYNIKKIPFDFLLERILSYNNYNWSQKYNIKYCIHFLIDNNLLENPNRKQSKNMLHFIISNKFNNEEYNFSPYWERHVFQKLWIFFMNTSFIDVLLENILVKINNDDIKKPCECPICYSEIEEGDVKLSCNHCFHKDCISNYYKHKNYLQNNIQEENEDIVFDCPYCRNIVLEI
jgi:hypothetical protein